MGTSIPITALPVLSPGSVQGTDVLPIVDLSDLTNPGGTTKQVTVNGLGVSANATNSLFNVKQYGAVGNGSTDDTLSIQAATTAAVAANGVLYFPVGQYLITSTIVINNTLTPNWPFFQAEGASCGSAESVVQSNNAGATILCNGCDGFTFAFTAFDNESVKISSLSFRQVGTTGTHNAITYNLNDTTYARKHWFDDLNFVNFAAGWSITGLSATTDFNFLGPTVLSRVNSYSCGSMLILNNVYLDLLHLTDCLALSCTTSGLYCIEGSNTGGGVIRIEKTHFEGCEPAAITTSNISTEITLTDVTTESCGVVSGNGAWNLGQNTVLHLLGNTVVPGTAEVPPKLGAFNSVSCTSPITIVGAGGLIQTPEFVTLAPPSGGHDWAYYPYAVNQLGSRRGTALSARNGSSLNAQLAPGALQYQYGFTAPGNIVNLASSLGTSASHRWLVASWVAGYNDVVYIGSGSQVTIGGVTTSYGGGATQSVPTQPWVGVFIQDVVASASVTAFAITLLDTAWNTLAYASFEDPTTTPTLAELGPPLETLRIRYGSAAPTTGVGSVGDIVFNIGMSAAGVFLWACTTAGTPGTWTPFYLPGATALVSSGVSLNNGAGSGAGTLTTAPTAGNPTKWIPINDNGTTRYIPAW